jgi:hypothetical protein
MTPHFFSRRLSLVLAGVMLAAFGGPAAAQGFRGEILIGVAATTLTGESVADFEPRTSLAGGAAFGYDFGNGLAVQPEVLYLLKGAAAEMTVSELARLLDEPDNPSQTPVDLRFKIVYLEVPVLVHYRFETRTRFHPRLFAGPALAYRLDAKVSYGARDAGPTFTQDDESVRDVDYGLVFGAGVEVETGFERFTLGARATIGRANTRQREPAIRNSGVVFFAGIVL